MASAATAPAVSATPPRLSANSLTALLGLDAGTPNADEDTATPKKTASAPSLESIGEATNAMGAATMGALTRTATATAAAFEQAAEATEAIISPETAKRKKEEKEQVERQRLEAKQAAERATAADAAEAGKTSGKAGGTITAAIVFALSAAALAALVALTFEQHATSLLADIEGHVKSIGEYLAPPPPPPSSWWPFS